MSIINSIVAKKPDLKRKLYTAAMGTTAEDYVSQKLKLAVYLGIGLAAFTFFITGAKGEPIDAIIKGILVGAIGALLGFQILMRQVDAQISKRAKLIDKDVLFAGRFLMVKLNSGRPLINALEDATKSYGIANEYFREIVKDIDLGTPLERALEKATINCPSQKLKKILFQITNALKIGTDVTDFLEAILDEVADQQLIEIQRYGKKLSSLTMFYMLFAIVMPSLGMTMIVVVISLLNVNITMSTFFLVIALLIFLQFIFLTMFRSIRPNVHI